MSAMQLDLARYRHHLASFAMSDGEQDEFLEQLWRIAHHFADQAFGLTPEQILLGTNGTKCPARTHDRLDSVHSLTPTFNDAAFGNAGRKIDP